MFGEVNQSILRKSDWMIHNTQSILNSLNIETCVKERFVLEYQTVKAVKQSYGYGTRIAAWKKDKTKNKINRRVFKNVSQF